ncbi:MAG: methyl-accepting chemotaxis protein [Myxococcota bacterium]
MTEEHGAKLPEEVQKIVLEELNLCREKVVERISKTRQLTDSEVYHAGVALNDVVAHAQGYMKQVNERMSSTASGGSAVDHGLENIQRIARTQEELVSDALKNLAGIAKAGRQIQETAGASRLLALNARVESARFGGEGGRAFNVIADEMRELSQSVETTNTMVSKLAGQLQKALPNIQAQTRSMSDSIATLASEMAEQNERLQQVFKSSIEEGSEALEKVLGSAQAGLSHLQFQDLLIQDLEGIERILRNTEGSIAEALGAETAGDDQSAFLGTIGADLDEASGGETDLESGEVLLF